MEHRLKATISLSIVADHVHPFMTTVYPSSDGYFQQDNAACHKAQIISDWFLEHNIEFTLLKWPPQSPDVNPIEHLWDVVEREIFIMDVQQQPRDAIMSIWTKISEECFQHLVESIPPRIKAVLKAKGGPVSVYIYIVTSVPVSHQRRPGNGGRTPALPRYRLIGPSSSSSAGSVISPADLSTVEFDLQKDCS